MRLHSLMPLLLATTMVATCGSAGNQTETIDPAADVRVIVRNDSFYDVTVHLLQGSARRRLGTVSGSSTETFVLPRQSIAGLAQLRFIVDYIGRRDNAASETILAAPGDEIHLNIQR